MKTNISAAKAQSIAMLAICLTSPVAVGTDRLDDWSSPRPIKYGAQSDVKPQMPASQPSRLPDAAPKTRVDRIVEPSPPLMEPQPPRPAFETSRFAPQRSANPDAEALFPVPELMRPEHLETAATSPPMPAFEIDSFDSQNQPRHRTAMLSRSDWSDIPSLPTVLTRSEPDTQLTSLEQDDLPVPNVGISTVSGWQLGRLASMKIVRAEQLLQRRSPMAARQQAIEALHLMAQSTDEISRTGDGTEALSQALTAVREASDFLGRFGVVDSASLQRLVDSHATLVLKRCDLDEVNPLRAADTYYEFARGRFVDAIGGWASASRALVIVAQTEPISADQSDNNLSAAQVCYLRSAVACDPDNAIAANALGHELLALGMFDEARWALEHSYAKQPSPATLQNLAELHRVTGNVRLTQACVENLALLQSQQAKVAQVVQLTPQQFAQMSPQIMTGGDRRVAAQSFVDPRGSSGPSSGNEQNLNRQTLSQEQGPVASAMDRVRGIFR